MGEGAIPAPAEQGAPFHSERYRLGDTDSALGRSMDLFILPGRQKLQAERICRFSSAGGADRNRKRSGRAGASSFRNFQCFSVPESPNSRSAPPKLSSRFGADSGIARQGTSVRRISSKSTRPTAKGPNPTLGYRRSESGGMENTYR